jgi:hypothetical protein
LRGAAQAAQRIFYFMRELSDLQAAPPQLRDQCVLPRQAPMLRDVLHFEEQLRAVPAERYLSHGAV